QPFKDGFDAGHGPDGTFLETPVQLLPPGVEKAGRRRPAEHRADDLDALRNGPAHEGADDLVDVEVEAETLQRLVQHFVRDRLAVDEHAVAVEDYEVPCAASMPRQRPSQGVSSRIGSGTPLPQHASLRLLGNG